MPYIPKAHEKYNLLPFLRENGGEVFSYDSGLENEITEMLPKNEHVVPYGYDSYEAFDAHLDEYIAKYGTSDEQLNDFGKRITEYRADIKRRNVKENWSVVKYVGESTGGISGFTHGKYYYWPCSIDKPEYEGVIDDEEFTSYRAGVMNNGKFTQNLENGEVTEFVEADSDWEVAEDPTGMAERKLLDP